MVFKTWDEVPDVPTAAHKKQKWFMEVFAGKAWLTRALRKAGWSTLPPVEINVEGDTLASADLLDPALRTKINNWISSGCLKLVHFGTPCTTFSRARKAGDGGPPPLRADDLLQGVPGLDAVDAEKVRLGTLFLDVTLELCRAISLAGGHWSIENPDSSMLWLMPQVIAFIQEFQPQRLLLHMCAYGSKHNKPTAFLVSGTLLEPIARTCPGVTASHVH